MFSVNIYKADLHTHTVSSGHAYSTVTENARVAYEKGLEVIAMTDHAPAMPGSCGQLHFFNIRVVPKVIEGVRVLRGAELNILNSDGDIDLPEVAISRLDIVIASLHTPCIAPMDEEETTLTLINTIKKPFVNIIGHPGDPRYPFDIKRVVSCARDNNTLLEINNSSFSPYNTRKGGEKTVLEMMKECKKQALPIAMGSDAHYCADVGNFQYLIPLIDEINFPRELIINTNTEDLFKFLEV